MSFLTEDNLYNRTMTKVFDLCMLSVITVICCIPVFTSGAALTSMYAVMMKMSNDIEGPVLASYVKEFKGNLKDSFWGSIIIVITIMLLIFDLSMWTQNEIENRSFFYGLTLAVLIMFVTTVDWYLVVRARFFEDAARAYGNALRFAVVYFPITVVSGVYTAFVAWTIMHYPVLLMFFPVGGAAILFYPKALLMGSRLDRYIDDKGLVPECDDGDDDDWEFPEGDVYDSEPEHSEKKESVEDLDENEQKREKVNVRDLKEEKNEWSKMPVKDKISYSVYNHMAGIVLGMTVLFLTAGLAFHFVFNGEVCGFNIAVVNGYSEVSDSDLSEKLNDLYDFDGKKKYAYVDTQYQLSYEADGINVENPAANNSFFDKYFLNIRTGAMDAAIIPKSFYEYCNSMGNIFYEVEYVLTKDQVKMLQNRFVTGTTDEGDFVTGINIGGCKYLNESGIAFVDTNMDDSYILVFPVNGTHLEECREFVDYIGIE